MVARRLANIMQYTRRVSADTMTAQQLVDAIQDARARLLAAVDALGASASIVAVTDEGWSAKDVLAHQIHYREQVAVALGAPIQPPAYVLAAASRRPSGDEWNALAVAHYGDQPLPDIRACWESLADVILEHTRTRSDGEMAATGAVAWAADRPLWQFIAGDTFMHWFLHASAIEAAAPSRS
jgi:hypothetical protein